MAEAKLTPNQVVTSGASSPCAVQCSTRPTLEPGRYAVQDLSQMEMLTQPLYSYQLYPAAGAQVLTFFQNANTGAVTLEDTNMQLPGQLPAPQAFLIQAIGVDFLSGLTAAAPVIFGAQAATGQANDMFSVLRRGVFTLTVGSKDYGTVAPLMALPPRSHMGASFGASDATTAGANMQLRMNVGYAQGPVWQINPILLQPSMAFRATISFPGGAVALPSTDALARIGVIFYGTLYRPPQ
jgi:hypothetical protein